MKKSRKRFDGAQEKRMAASIDRFPDEILVHILSFMSTKDCVRSSILGKRWRSLWTGVSNLKLDSKDHPTVMSFSNFVNRFVFIHKGNNINTFRFEQDYFALMECIECWNEIETLMATAIDCNVQVINIRCDDEFMLPCIFTCKTVVDLTLIDLTPIDFYEDYIPMTTTAVCLPALKKLLLSSIGYESEESLVHLLSGCPVLDELTIYEYDAKVACLYVSSPTLTSLELERQYSSLDEAYEVKLDTPALKYLRLHDHLSEEFSSGMLALLTKADVVFKAPTGRDVLLYSRSVLEFVGKLNNVKCLELTTRWNCMEVPDSAFYALTTEFRNLAELELSGDWRFIPNFLENSDNLEVLTIRMVGKHRYWMEPKQVPGCLMYHLGTVRLFNFKCLETEFNMVEYILRNAKVLKTMEIRFNKAVDDVKEKYEALQRISMFERASAFQLAFS